MAEVKYEGLVELRSRLPYISETVITYFLSKYGNVEECYEKLKNGHEDSPDPSYATDDTISKSSQNFVSQTTPTKTNERLPRRAWTIPQQDGYQRERQHSQDGRAQNLRQSWTPPGPPRDSGYSDSHFEADVLVRCSELMLDQRHQVEFLHKARVECSQIVNSLRDEVDHKRQLLTRLRIDVSDSPTRMDITSLQEIITTLEDDVQSFQIKIQAEQNQSENLKMFTEEGVRWNCQGCKFLNHPLMSRCESCNLNRL